MRARIGSPLAASDFYQRFRLLHSPFPVWQACAKGFRSPGKFFSLLFPERKLKYPVQLYNDFLANPTEPIFDTFRTSDTHTDRSYLESLTDKNLEKAFMSIAKPAYDERVAPSMACVKRCGNMYTGSLYGGLASLISSVSSEQLAGKRVLMFAFGGGCAASLYALHFVRAPERVARGIDLLRRLADMRVTPVDEYMQAMKVCNRLCCCCFEPWRLNWWSTQMRELNHCKFNCAPEGSIDNISRGAFYLDRIDDRRRRFYKRKGLQT